MREPIVSAHTERAVESRGADRGSAVTVIGLGSMGSALAGAVLEAGYPTTVWNRTAGKAEPLVRRGAARRHSRGGGLGQPDRDRVCPGLSRSA